MSRIGTRRQVADVAALATFRLPMGPAGLLIGRHNTGEPAVVRVFAPEPTRVAVVGGWWLGRLLAFRAMALGARVVVRTVNVDQWKGLSEWATGRPDRLAVVAPTVPLTLPPASQSQPMLHVLDGPAGAESTTPAEPWHTRLTLIHQITHPVPRELVEPELRIVQCLTAPEVAVAQAPLRLTGQTAGLLQALNADMVAILGAGQPSFVWLTPTAGELQALGAPRR